MEKEETENPPPFRVGEMRIFSFRGSEKITGEEKAGKSNVKNQLSCPAITFPGPKGW
jgi:hypothetical protein